MRTLCLVFVTADVIFAQAPMPVAPPTMGQFFPPSGNLPGLLPTPSPYRAAPSSSPDCEALQKELKGLADLDPIARPPAPTGDRNFVGSVPCTDVTGTAPNLSPTAPDLLKQLQERQKHLQDARDQLRQWREAQPEAPVYVPLPVPAPAVK